MSWDLSEYGGGEVRDKCGEVHMTGMCEHGHEQIDYHTCGDRTCPNCAEIRHILPLVVTIVARLITALKRRVGDRIVILRVEPDIEKVGSAAYFDMRSEAKDRAKAAGLVGGASLLQPNSGENPAYIVIGLVEDNVEFEDRRDRWSITVENSFSEFDWEQGKGYSAFAQEVKGYVESAQWASKNQKVVAWFGELHGTKFDNSPYDYIREERRISDLVECDPEESNSSGGNLPLQSKDRGECPIEECSGTFYQIHDLDKLIRSGSLGQWEYFRAKVAYQYFCGMIEPPPDLKPPSDTAEYEGMLETLLEQEGYPTAPRDPVPAAVREKAS